MHEQKWFAVSNPVSGGGRGARDRDRIAALLREAGLDFELSISQSTMAMPSRWRSRPPAKVTVGSLRSEAMAR